MKKEQIMVVVGLIIAALLVSNFVCFGKIKQLKHEAKRLNQMIQQKGTDIKSLTEQLQSKQQELDSSKKELANTTQELASTKEELDGIKQGVVNLNNKFNAPKTKSSIPATAAKKQ